MQHSQQQAPEPVHTTPAQKLKAALDIAATMPPSKIRKNLIGLINLAPEIEDNLMEKIDLPLQIDDSNPDQPFLKTQFNRDGDSYRSCLTNQYYPASEGYLPSAEFRRIEEMGNVLFSEYTKLYYGNGAVSSLYVAEGNNADNFSIGFYVKKDCTEESKLGFVGSWDSFNVADVHIEGEEATIKLNTTVLIEMNSQSDQQGAVDLTGFLKKTKTERRKLGKEKLEDIIVAFGELVQDLQTIMRQHLQAIYIGKTREVTFTTRFEYTVEYEKQRRSLAQGLRDVHLQVRN